MAIDEDLEKIREGAAGITYPVLMDAEHLLTELYAISNVPTVVLIDEAGRIARPNTVLFGTDTFAEFTGVESAGHLDLVRRWVQTGEVDLGPDEARAAVGDLSDDEVAARLHFRMAVHLLRAGDEAGAARHFDIAGDLAPHDWTIRRAQLPLRGDDPFGPTFFALYEQWQAAGSPYHGLSAP